MKTLTLENRFNKKKIIRSFHHKKKIQQLRKKKHTQKYIYFLHGFILKKSHLYKNI
jgi:hypothetical protein